MPQQSKGYGLPLIYWKPNLNRNKTFGAGPCTYGAEWLYEAKPLLFAPCRFVFIRVYWWQIHFVTPVQIHSTAILTYTPFATCSSMTDWGESATSLWISMPRTMGPG